MKMTNHGAGNRLTRAFSILAVSGLVMLTAGSCDFLDPTSVENPRTTDEDLARALNPTASLLPGLRAQFSRMVQSTVVLTETVSDNYSIHGTGLDHAYDLPRTIGPGTVNSTGVVTGAYWNAQELKALATFLIDVIMPGDDRKTPAMVAEAHYRRGMAYLHLAENFAGAPVALDGTPQTAAQLLDLARADLMEAEGVAGPIGLAAKAALARVHRWAGDAAAAAAAAGQVIAADPEFVFFAEYDAASVSNQPYAYLVSRALKEMQPLPRLDFLDPKYTHSESSIPVAKAEEMHLIMAEAAMASGQWATGAGHLATAIEVAHARPTQLFSENDQRLNNDGSPRPRHSTILVASAPGSEYRAGLVLDRPGQVVVRPISGTSLNADSIRAIPATNQDALLHALYLARQEIMLLEGRRMADLGIRLPIMRREIETNPNINAGDLGTQVVVPAWIPVDDEIDRFTPASPYPPGTQPSDDTPPATTQVVILHDLNRILVQNRAAALPLF
jgi:hypothetical protein